MEKSEPLVGRFFAGNVKQLLTSGSQVRTRFYAYADIFLFECKSQFNDLCLQAANKVKKIRPNVKPFYVRAEYPHISENYKDYLLNFYDDTYFPNKILNACRAAYVKHNYHMIDWVNICIFYFGKTYSPSYVQISNNLTIPIQRSAEQSSLMIMPYQKRKQ